MSELTLTSVVLISALVFAFALVAGALFLQWRQLQALQKQHNALLQSLAATLQQQQGEMLAMGQRILEADKLVRRFSERIDAIEYARPTQMQYGQLESLLEKSIGEETEASAAETELLMLLRQQQRRN